MVTQTSNINIKSLYGLMCYLIDYIDSYEYADKEDIVLYDRPGSTDLDLRVNNLSKYNILPLKKYKSYWENIDNDNIITLNYLPDSINISKVKLYFPQFSVDTYERGANYAFTLNTWINGKRIYLGSYLIDRLNSLACSPIKRGLGNNYYEYIEVPIIDPKDIMYADEWDEFRKLICGEPKNVNNTGSVITLTLFPVTPQKDNTYIPMDNYVGAQGALNLYKNNSVNYLKLNLDFLEQDNPQFAAKTIYNEEFTDLREYLKETYNISYLENILYILTILNEDNIYKKITKKFKGYFFTKENETVQFDKDNTCDGTSLCFDSWDDWIDGLFVSALIVIKGYNKLNVLCEIDIPSNKIPFTKNIMRYFIKDNDFIKKIDLDLTDMNVYNIDAINKIENKVIQLDTPEDSKSNISYPVFYRVTELNNIFIHPGTTENICVNLDKYKALVKRFFIEIAGISFIEIGRTYAGVIFKIVGNELPKDKTQGTYYIKKEDGVTVTSGEYKYK